MQTSSWNAGRPTQDDEFRPKTRRTTRVPGGARRRTPGSENVQSSRAQSAAPRTHLIAAYSVLVLLLFVCQAIMTLRSRNQIRYEELAESVRNVYWFEYRRIYDSISSNIGWYAILLFVYKGWGFTLHTAKYVRLGLHLVSLLCLCAVLRRWLGSRVAWLPLCTLGLSPTWLYFNTLQAQYGFDLQVFPIFLYLVIVVQTERPWLRALAESLLWSLAMLASMAYPVVVIGLPFLAFLYARAIAGTRAGPHGCWQRDVLVSCVAFLLPLAVGCTYVQDRAELATGLFRGGGAMQPSPSIAAIQQLLGDLFTGGNSYMFDLKQVDFSGVLGMIPLAFALTAAGWIFARERSSRLPLFLGAGLLILSCLIVSLAGATYTGMRRGTGALVGAYAVFTIIWAYFSRSMTRQPSLSWIPIVICALLPLHHVIAFRQNILAMSILSPYREKYWFAVSETPAAALTYWLAQTQKGAPLMCVGKGGSPQACQYTYSEIFAAIAGSRHWNGLQERPVMAYDAKKGEVIRLSIDLWKENYLH